MSLQDGALLIAGTVSSGITVPWAASGNITTSASPAPFSVDLNPTAVNGINGLPGGGSIDIGEGTPLYLQYTIPSTISGNSATSLTINIVTDSNANLTTSPVTLATKTGIPLTAGTRGFIQVPPQVGSLGKEFLGATVASVGGNPTAGSILMIFTNQVDDPAKYYQSGFSVV